jgi:ATPase
MKIKTLVPDTSVLIEGLVSERIKKKSFEIEKLMIHEAVIAELEHQSNKNRTIGFLGLDEIEKLKQYSSKFGFELEFRGRRPSQQEIKHSSLGEIDALIRSLAYEEGATLFTGDSVQAKVAQIMGVQVEFEEIRIKKKTLKFEKYFDNTTMSVHLRENCTPFAKRGLPGNWKFVPLAKTKLDRGQLEEISKEVIDEATIRTDGFVEIERKGSSIVQLGLYRIVITRPPFSDGWEMTAVKPIKILELDDYKLTDKLRSRLAEQAEGILISGSPGMGKSTFAQALAMFYANQGKIVKTVEAPRDLTLPDEVTQLSVSHGTPQEIHDVLLLSRPDYTIFDEMRNTPDFRLFADLRLAGIGLAGVVHGTNPIDAIQRFVGRIELGLIPQIIDTVIFIKNGGVHKVLNLKMMVKVPTGMTEADLARPVVVVTDFESDRIEYELYTYGEETVVIPITGSKGISPAGKLATRSIQDALKQVSRDIRVEMVSDHKCIVYSPKRHIAKLIGKGGKNIERLERQLGISIDVQELAGAERKEPKLKSINFELGIDDRRITFSLGGKHRNADVDIYIEEDFLFSAKAGKDGKLKLNRDSDLADYIADAVNAGQEIKLILK